LEDSSYYFKPTFNEAKHAYENYKNKLISTNFVFSCISEQMPASSAQRVIFLACGSFNPPTNLHLRLFELAKDHFRVHQPLSTVLGGVISPVHDGYKKSSLISSQHRLSMARLSVAREDTCVRVSDWETRQEGWSRTRHVLDSYTRIANTQSEAADWLPPMGSSDQGPITFKLLCGADLLGECKHFYSSFPTLLLQKVLLSLIFGMKKI